MKKLGECYGFEVGWSEYKGSTPYTVSNKWLRVPRISRLSLAMMMCDRLDVIQPESVLNYKPDVPRERQSPNFVWVERQSTYSRSLCDLINEPVQSKGDS